MIDNLEATQATRTTPPGRSSAGRSGTKMGYSAEHSDATRRRILEGAGQLFRRLGYDGASIDAIMARAGLTRGAFYQHFKSKADLFAGAVGQDLVFTKELRRGREHFPDDPRMGAETALDYYLQPDNTKKIARGCTIVSNAADMARASKKARTAFTFVFQELVKEFESMVDAEVGNPERRALSALATCVGGVVLARALADDDLISNLLEGCREAAGSNLAGSSK